MNIPRFGILLVLTTFAFGQDSLVIHSTWKQYFRLGATQAEANNGGFGYYRLNRRTEFNFNDVRLFAYKLESDSFVYLRYKSSQKKRRFPKLFTFTTLSYRRNTRAGMNVQYHYNQGAGYFIQDYTSGHLTIELGHAFDMSDYLNDSRKTSYIKGGLYWDQDTPWFSSKLEGKYFFQISDINVTNLTRTQVMMGLDFPIKNGISFHINYEAENFHKVNYSQIGTAPPSLNTANSLTFALGWRGNLNWDF